MEQEVPATPAQLVPKEGGAHAGQEQGADACGLVVVLQMGWVALCLLYTSPSPRD